MPQDSEKPMDVSDLVYTFCDVMDYIDLTPSVVAFGNFIRTEANATRKKKKTELPG